MIDRFELKSVLAILSKRYDFTVELVQTCNENYGEYFPKRSHIVLYVLNDKGEYIGDKRVMLEAIHELAHHCQSNRKGFEFTAKNEHGCYFRMYFVRLLERYYGQVPNDVLSDLDSRGYLSPKDINKLRRKYS